jgi:hypothetical protein
MIFHLNLIVRVSPVHVGDISVIVVESSSSRLVWRRDACRLKSLDDLLLSLAISKSELDASSSCALIGQVVDVSVGWDDMLNSNDKFKVFSVCTVRKVAQVKLNDFSR